MLTGMNFTAVAEKVGIARTTLITWRKWPMFIERYQQEKTMLQEQTKNMLQRSTPLAIGTIVDLMRNNAYDIENIPVETPIQTRLAAAARVLEFFFKGMEIEEVQAVKDSITELQNLLEPDKYHGLRSVSVYEHRSLET